MSTELDLLNASRIDLDKAVNSLIEEYHPVFEQALNNAPEVVKGSSVNFTVVHTGPGSGRALTGGVDLPSGRTDISDQGVGHPGDWAYAYDLNELALGEAISADELGMYAEQYPAAAIAHTTELIVEQLVQGSAPQGTGVFTTLNGDVTYDPLNDGGTYSQTGLLQFAAPASQTTDCFGLARQGTTGINRWANGYGNITSVADDGMRTFIETLMWSLRGAQAKRVGIPTLGLTDATSWLNFWDTLYSRFTPVEFKDDKALEEDPLRMGLNLTRGFKLWFEPALDPSAGSPFNSPTGRDGVIYGLNPKDLRTMTYPMYTKVVGGKRVLKGILFQREFVASPDGLRIKAAMIARWGLLMRSLSSHFVIEGSGNP